MLEGCEKSHEHPTYTKYAKYTKLLQFRILNASQAQCHLCTHKTHLQNKTVCI